MTEIIRTRCSELIQLVITFKDRLTKIEIALFPYPSLVDRVYLLAIDLEFTRGADMLSKSEKIFVSQLNAGYYHTSDRKISTRNTVRLEGDKSKNDFCLKSLKNLYDVYETTTKFFIETITAIAPNIKLFVPSLHSLPEFNYMLRFWSDTKFGKRGYRILYHSGFDDDVSNCFQLMALSKKFEKEMLSKRYKISDYQLVQECVISIKKIRQLVVDQNIPFQAVIKNKVVSELLIDAKALRNAVTDTLAVSDFIVSRINASIDQLTIHQDKVENRKEVFLKKYPLQVEGFVLLKSESADAMIGKVLNIEIGNGTVQLAICNVKNDLKTGSKIRFCQITEVDKFVNYDKFVSQPPPGGWKRLVQLKRLLDKQKKSKLISIELSSL